MGWVTALVSTPGSSNPPRNVFAAVVLSDVMAPVLSNAEPHFCGVFLKDMSEEKAKERAKEWMKPGGIDFIPTTASVGRA